MAPTKLPEPTEIEEKPIVQQVMTISTSSVIPSISTLEFAEDLQNYNRGDKLLETPPQIPIKLKKRDSKKDMKHSPSIHEKKEATASHAEKYIELVVSDIEEKSTEDQFKKFFQGSTKESQGLVTGFKSDSLSPSNPSMREASTGLQCERDQKLGKIQI